MVFDSVPDFWRKRVQVGFNCRFGVEVEYGTKQILELLRIQFGHVAIENQVNIRAARIGISVARSDRSHASATAELDVLIPFLFLNWSAIDLEVNTIVFDQNLADASLVPRLGCRPPHSHH